MRYQVGLTRNAQRQLDALPADVATRIAWTLLHLAENPRPIGVRKLQGRVALWRIRMGDYRIIYAITDSDRSVEVVRIARRNERTYEGLI